ncbi:angiotensin-converting enzyme-like [Panulirus ornatus]|uniref:angiotensin-converting enzyme-like n=1 Tax=Panulirus ornatus TaxID=150431 RepID=UPI003A8C52B1
MQALGMVFLLAATGLPWVSSGPATGGIALNTYLEGPATGFLKSLNELSSLKCNKYSLAAWEYYTNLTDATRQAEIAAKLEHTQWEKEAWEMVQSFGDSWTALCSDSLKRQFEFLSIQGISALSDDELKELTDVQSQMLDIHSKAKVCDFRNRTKCDLSLKPDLEDIFRTSQDYEELSYLWRAWRDASGGKMRDLYKDYVRLSNKAATLSGFDNMADMWLMSFNETGTFMESLEATYKQLSPFYKELHAYVRRKLREVYGEKYVTADGPIPDHLLGDAWAQRWENIYDLVAPYPNRESIDVTDQMKQQGYTPRKMFELADDFFASLNLTRVPQSFWEKSVIEKPKDREIVCHASAWDFCDRKDVRIKMCTEVNMADLITIHHEMGHVQYFLQYKDQPLIFRRGANGGFHEALGDVLSLSVSTPKHLKQIGLLDIPSVDKEVELNFLMKMALSKIGFVPFAYLIDLWRWQVFRGDIPESDWNCAWWKLRLQLQGVKPPVLRTEDDLDPPAKYHVAADVPYIRYYVAVVLQFQFHKALCLKAGEYDPLDPAKPLHNCDIYQSTEAGNALKEMMRMGKSRPWPEALEALTGDRKMDSSVIREYFRPLEEWIREDNRRNGEVPGWRDDGEHCKKKSCRCSPVPGDGPSL